MAVDEPSSTVLRLVFLRLPWKLLFRFKAVSKSWDSIIADPTFPAEYRRFCGRSSCLQYAGHFLYPTRHFYSHVSVPIRFFGNGTVSERELTSAFHKHNSLHPEAQRYFICSSNGILLCYSVETVRRKRGNKWRMRRTLCYYVCNPLTSEWQALPFPPNNALGVVGFHCREEDPSKPGSYEYEVVKVLLFCKDGPSETMVHIYSSKSRRWSIRRCRLQTPSPVWFRWDHSRHFAMVSRGVFYWSDGNGRFMAYYPTLHRLEEMTRPSIYSEWGDRFSIGENLKGEVVGYVIDGQQFSVWVHCDAGFHGTSPEWQKELEVKFDDLEELLGKVLTQPYLNQMPGDPGKVLLGIPGALEYSFDLTTGKMEELPHGQASCLGRMYNRFYCPYHLPSCYFRL